MNSSNGSTSQDNKNYDNKEVGQEEVYDDNNMKSLGGGMNEDEESDGMKEQQMRST